MNWVRRALGAGGLVYVYQGPVGQRFLARLVTSGVLDLSGEGFEDDHGRELLEARLAAVDFPRDLRLQEGCHNAPW